MTVHDALVLVITFYVLASLGSTLVLYGAFLVSGRAGEGQ